MHILDAGTRSDPANASEFEVIQLVRIGISGRQGLSGSGLCLITLYALISAASLAGNGLFLFLSFRYRGLRRHISYIMMSLAGSNLLVTCICVPASAYRLFYLSWSLGEVGCKLVMFVEALALAVNSFSLATVAIIRARQSALMIPPGRSSNRGLRLVVPATWLLAALVSVPALFAVSLEHLGMADLLNLTALTDTSGANFSASLEHSAAGRPVIHLCSEHRRDMSGRASQMAYSAYFLLLLFLSPCIVLTFSYGFTARFISRQFARLAMAPAQSQNPTATAAECVALGRPSRSLSGSGAGAGGRHTPQAAAACHAREVQKRTVKTVAVLVAFFFCAWFPKDLIIVLQDFVFYGQQNQAAAAVLTKFYPYTQALIYLHSALCPLLYWCLSRVFRRYVCQAFPCRRP